LFVFFLFFNKEQKHIIIFGDFNMIPTASEFDALVQRNYSYIIQQNTNISLKTPQGSTCIDNIWLSAEAKVLSTGKIFIFILYSFYFLLIFF
jgi:hypothetical protein